MHSNTAPSFEAPLIPRSVPPKTYPFLFLEPIPFCTQNENEASSSSHTFNILARIIPREFDRIIPIIPCHGGGL